MSSGSGSSGSSAGYDSKGNVVGSNTFGFEGFSEKAGVTSFSADPGLASFSEGGYEGYKGRATYAGVEKAYYDKIKNTLGLWGGGIMGLLGLAGIFTPVGVEGVVVGGEAVFECPYW